MAMGIVKGIAIWKEKANNSCNDDSRVGINMCIESKNEIASGLSGG